MGTFFVNDQGVKVGLCPVCKIIKPSQVLRASPYSSEQFIICHECNRTNTRNHQQIGQRIRLQIFEEAGGCQWFGGCHLRYPRDYSGNFALDHVNPKLKLHKSETRSGWIASNLVEFETRVKPNLQVLCNHHNTLKGGEEYGVGGFMHIEPWDQEDIDNNSVIHFDEIQPQLFNLSTEIHNDYA
jgi:hypothetical protein